jgi:mRNA-degrading endonuclease RelE of RelBE toxin-antitoxin system
MTRMTIKIDFLPGFEKDLKRLKKKYRSLDSDIETFIESSLRPCHELKEEQVGIFQIPGLKIEHPKIYKAKKFACECMKGTGVKSGIRIIYAYFEQENKVEFIEIYYKGDKKDEDKERLKAYCRQFLR